MTPLRPTAFQTTGPFFPPDFLRPGDNDLTWRRDPARRARGERLCLCGRVTEQAGMPRGNAVIELWQADSRGCFDHPLDPRAALADPDFAGWGRTATDAEGRFRFLTVRPGAYDDPVAGMARAPHVNIQILSSGLMRRLVTAFFFPVGDALASLESMPADPVLAAVPAQARGRLLAQAADPPADVPAGTACYRVDIVLQGEAETPFFLD